MGKILYRLMGMKLQQFCQYETNSFRNYLKNILNAIKDSFCLLAPRFLLPWRLWMVSSEAAGALPKFSGGLISMKFPKFATWAVQWAGNAAGHCVGQRGIEEVSGGAEPDPFGMLPLEGGSALLLSPPCSEPWIRYSPAHRNLIMMLFSSHCLNSSPL